MVSDAARDGRRRAAAPVLILVLMEYGLWLIEVTTNLLWKSVLILVLMEYGLWHKVVMIPYRENGLNPCSNGIWSLTVRRALGKMHCASS